ncbi:hypothetical protein K501DRAFT_275337 [Backusella circina FSU 941]|nr:hypothetical protein K501DRAFT_275337 [Backusella circina FSU 941]
MSGSTKRSRDGDAILGSVIHLCIRVVYVCPPANDHVILSTAWLIPSNTTETPTSEITGSPSNTHSVTYNMNQVNARSIGSVSFNEAGATTSKKGDIDNAKPGPKEIEKTFKRAQNDEPTDSEVAPVFLNNASDFSIKYPKHHWKLGDLNISDQFYSYQIDHLKTLMRNLILSTSTMLYYRELEE